MVMTPSTPDEYMSAWRDTTTILDGLGIPATVDGIRDALATSMHIQREAADARQLRDHLRQVKLELAETEAASNRHAAHAQHLAAKLAAAEATLDQAQARVAELEGAFAGDPMLLQSALERPGDCTIEHPAVRMLASSFAKSLGPHPNYIELRLITAEGEALLVTIQRASGQSPGELRRLAQEEVEAWRDWAQDVCSLHGACSVPPGTDAEIRKYLTADLHIARAPDTKAHLAMEALASVAGALADAGVVVPDDQTAFGSAVRQIHATLRATATALTAAEAEAHRNHRRWHDAAAAHRDERARRQELEADPTSPAPARSLEREVERLHVMNQHLTQALRGKLVFAELDVTDRARPWLAIMVAPDTTSETAAQEIALHLAPLLHRYGLRTAETH